MTAGGGVEAAAWRTVELREDGRGGRLCTRRDAAKWRQAGGFACDEAEVAMLPPPGWLASKLCVANPVFELAPGAGQPGAQSG